MAMTLEEMEKEIRQLKEQLAEARYAKDYLEIWKLQSLYSHLYNIGRREDIPKLFAQHTPEVMMEIEDSGVYDNLESITRFWNTVLGPNAAKVPGFMAVHMTLNPIIEIDKTGNRAKGIWHSHGYCVLKMQKLIPFICLGKYDMEYIKEEGQWKFLKFFYRQIFMSPYDKGWVEAPSVGSIAASPFNKPDRPTTYHQPYDPNKVNFFPPAPPEPYRD